MAAAVATPIHHDFGRQIADLRWQSLESTTPHHPRSFSKRPLTFCIRVDVPRLLRDLSLLSLLILPHLL